MDKEKIWLIAGHKVEYLYGVISINGKALDLYSPIEQVLIELLKETNKLN